MMAWKEKIVADMNEAGIESLGRLTQKETAEWCLAASVMAYPSDFYEIDCISIKKAQACGCVPVTTNFAAFEESNHGGIKVKTDRTIENWSLPYQIGFGTKFEPAQIQWVDHVVSLLTRQIAVDDLSMREWTKKFAWPTVSKQWLDIFS